MSSPLFNLQLALSGVGSISVTPDSSGNPGAWMIFTLYAQDGTTVIASAAVAQTQGMIFQKELSEANGMLLAATGS
jgi:hypothetical protein